MSSRIGKSFLKLKEEDFPQYQFRISVLGNTSFASSTASLLGEVSNSPLMAINILFPVRTGEEKSLREEKVAQPEMNQARGYKVYARRTVLSCLKPLTQSRL